MPRGDQISRQWRILQMLEAQRGGVSVPELASQLESNVRTTYRDVEALEISGFPLLSEKVDGVDRWQFVEDYRPKMPVPFTLTEMMALVIAEGHLKAFSGTVFSDALTHAFEKMRSMLKPEAHAFIEGLSKTFVVGLAGKKDYRQYRETIDVINKAVIEHRTIELDYNPASGEKQQRRVDPYHVWFMGGTIYVVGLCHERKQLRLFVIDRIENAKHTDDRFEAPADFSMDEFTKGRFRVMGDGEEVKVKIQFDSQIAYYIKERTWHPTQEISENSDGSIVLAMNVEGLAEVKSWVLSFGSLAKALAPDEFRSDVAAELGKAREKYI